MQTLVPKIKILPVTGEIAYSKIHYTVNNISEVAL